MQKNKSNNYWIVAVVVIAAAIVIWPLVRRDSAEEAGIALDAQDLDLATEDAGTVSAGLMEDGNGGLIDTGRLSASVAGLADGAASRSLPATMTVETYFARESDGADSATCAQVYAVPRTVTRTTAVARTALAELLAGPTAEEAALGYLSALPADLALRSLAIQEGVAVVTLNRALSDGAESDCRARAMTAQITQTLKQFPTVVGVTINS